ncbi:hypothetical protein EDC04DRAFT_2901631 [Pisolithus marmoratus]|nr:hypothetical protein EDC04DRAFT_2901631 [Pisolithus marmoratus]
MSHATFAPLQQSNAALAFRASEQIQANDPRGRWSAMDIRLISFDSVIHKLNLPAEWDIAYITSTGGMPQYIIDAYRYIQSVYDGGKPLHQLAVICGIICAGLLPNIFCPKLPDYRKNERQYTDFARALDWVARDRKGVTWAGPFITMVSGFIISIYDPSSPIAARINSCGDLNLWWAKHTAKGINAFLLVCLGLASIETPSGFRSAKWNSGGTYGGFDAVRYLAGIKAANILHDKHFATAHALPAMTPQPSTSKRKARDWDNEEEDDIVACSSVGTHRKVARLN